MRTKCSRALALALIAVAVEDAFVVGMEASRVVLEYGGIGAYFNLGFCYRRGSCDKKTVRHFCWLSMVVVEAHEWL